MTKWLLRVRKCYFNANCNWHMSKAVPRWKPAPPEKSRICPKFGLDGVGLLPPKRQGHYEVFDRDLHFWPPPPCRSRTANNYPRPNNSLGR
jgi:hypothetical protein